MSATRILKDNELLHALKTKVDCERRLAVEILELLQQVQDRMLHLKMGYPSLLAFCVQELKYSESTAYRRISALRLSAEVPDLKDQLQSGELTFQAVAQVQTFLNQEKKQNHKTYSSAEKVNLVKEVISKNTRQIEQVLAEKSPGLAKPETSRQITATQRQVVMTISAELDAKLTDLRSRYSHRNSNPSLAQLVELMADEILKSEEIKYQRAQMRAVKRSAEQSPVTVRTAAIAPPQEETTARLDESRQTPTQATSHIPSRPPGPLSSNRPLQSNQDSASQHSAPVGLSAGEGPRQEAPPTRSAQRVSQQSNPSSRQTRLPVRKYLPATVQYEVRMRGGGKCSYVDPETGKRCESRHQLEIDHIQPIALGGTDHISNLRLACRAHNSYFAVRAGVGGKRSKEISHGW